MDRPILSICIASYNKADITYKLVSSILNNRNDKLTVVVVDNASTDNTVELLSSIRDERFKLVVNETNIGGGANLVKALYSCETLFGLYCNDRDIIYPESLDNFIFFLESHSYLAGGWSVRYEEENAEEYTEYDLVESMKNINYRCEHPTGFFYNCDYLKKIDSEKMFKFATEKSYVPFPWENILAEVSFLGKTAKYNRSIWRSTGDTSHNNYISSYVALNSSEDRWFSPSNSIARARANVLHLNDLLARYSKPISNEDLNEIYALIIDAQLKIGIGRYIRVLESKSLAYHYSVQMRKVSIIEANKLGNQMIEQYISFVDENVKLDTQGRIFIVSSAKNTKNLCIKNELIWRASKSRIAPFLKRIYNSTRKIR